MKIQQLSTIEDRVQWLESFLEVKEMIYDKDEFLMYLFMNMQRDGLYSESSHFKDCKSGIIKALKAAEKCIN